MRGTFKIGIDGYAYTWELDSRPAPKAGDVSYFKEKFGAYRPDSKQQEEEPTLLK